MNVEQEFTIDFKRKPAALVDQLIETLVKANETGYSELEMGAYVAHLKSDDRPHLCGTAACVCGYEAMERAGDSLNAMQNIDIGGAAVAEELLEVMGFELGASIYDSHHMSRKQGAICSCRFSDEELLHPHLTRAKPSMEDAISYLELVRSKL